MSLSKKWTSLYGSVVEGGKKGEVHLAREAAAVADIATGDSVVVRLGAKHPPVQLQAKVDEHRTDGQIVFGRTDYGALGWRAEDSDTSVQVRARRVIDSVRNLWSTAVLGIVATVVLAVVAILPLWPFSAPAAEEPTAQVEALLERLRDDPAVRPRALSLVEEAADRVAPTPEQARTREREEQNHQRAELGARAAGLLFAIALGVPLIVRALRGRGD